MSKDKITFNGAPLVEEARIATRRFQRSERDGLQLLRRHPALWKGLVVHNSGSSNPVYEFNVDVFEPANNIIGGEYDD